MSSQSSASNRFDVEWIAMQAGIKPANRVTISPEHVPALEARAHRDGFVTIHAETLIEFPGRPPSRIVYIAPDATYAQRLKTTEAPLLPPGKSTVSIEEAIPLHNELGRLLGFPLCCVEEFTRRLRRSVTRRRDGREAHEDFVAAEHAASASQRFLGRLNDLAADRHVRIVTFYPCRYDCDEAASYASRVFAALERLSQPGAAAMQAALLGTFSIATDGSRMTGKQQTGDALTLTFRGF